MLLHLETDVVVKWLRTKRKEKPELFPHWALVHP